MKKVAPAAANLHSCVHLQGAREEVWTKENNLLILVPNI